MTANQNEDAEGGAQEYPSQELGNDELGTQENEVDCGELAGIEHARIVAQQ